MRRGRRSLAALLLGLGLGVLLLGLGLGVLLPAEAVGASRPLVTGIAGSESFFGSDAGLAFERTRDAGATAARLTLDWRDIAPSRPADPTNPDDRGYRWGAFDRSLQLAVAQRLTPLVTVSEAPSWTERAHGGRPGANLPDPVELGHFAEAAARRYNGGFRGLPRVQYWEVWNEANASFFLYPQTQGGHLVSPEHYRQMVNALAAGVHGVHADNQVVAGALFPFVINRADVEAIGPLRFMRELLCMSRRLRPKRHCGDPVQFDIWSHHPYTSGGPTHRAGNPNSVSIRELPRMRRLLRAASRFNRIVHSGPLQFWVTEFSWDSNPPDPHGVPSRLHARWVAEALYRMWRARVSLVTWFQLRDDESDGRPDSQVFQSGLYSRCGDGIRCDQPKRALEAFRFPFVAFRSGRRVSIWGRTPAGLPADVIVEQAVGRGWRRVLRLHTDSVGVFKRRIRTSRRRPLRARLAAGRPVSLPFSLKRSPDRPVNPFG